MALGAVTSWSHNDYDDALLSCLFDYWVQGSLGVGVDDNNIKTAVDHIADGSDLCGYVRARMVDVRVHQLPDPFLCTRQILPKQLPPFECATHCPQSRCSVLPCRVDSFAETAGAPIIKQPG